MKKDNNSSFPKNLELWLEDDILRYRVEEKELDTSKTDFLKSNKDFFRMVLKKSESKKIKVLPLAHNQKALWFLNAVNPNTAAYNISLVAEILSPLNTGAFDSAISYLISQHSLLRTIFADLPGDDNIPCQIVSDKIHPEVEQVDAQNLSENQIENLLIEKSRIPFNLKTGPSFRIIVINANHTTILSFIFHHIICDAISLRNLLNEFIHTYDSLNQNKSIEVPVTSFDYGNFIFHQQEFLKSDAGEHQINYWVKHLIGKPFILNLPEKYRRPSVHKFNGSTFLFKIDGKRYLDLKLSANNANTTFNVLLLSAFEYFISKISGQRDFCIGVPASARTSKDFENVFGYFLNLLPFRCSLTDQKAFNDFLGENKKIFYESLENQDVPFPIIVERLSPKRDPARTPIFQVIFNYLNKKSLGPLLHFLGDSDTREYSSWGSLSIKPYRFFDQEGQVDMTMEIIDDDHQLLCSIKYNTDLFDIETITQFHKEFINILDMLIKYPDFKPVWLSGECIKRLEKPKLIVKITGTFTVEPVKPYLESWFDKFSVTPSIEFPGYNQVFSQLLNPLSDFNNNLVGYNILLIRFEDWISDKSSYKSDQNFDNKIGEFENALLTAFQINSGGRYIIAICPPSSAILKNTILAEIIKEKEKRIYSFLKQKSNVSFLGSDELLKTYDVSDYYEEMGEQLGHIPFSDEFFISLSTILARKIHVSLSYPIKAIAVDCDNTIWKGVVAEDGPLEVIIGPAEKELQEFLVEQVKAGVLICLCSKNREDDVFEVFEKNDRMILKKEHISFYRINWNPKSDNLIQLAKDINIGLDSFVFIDDNPVECAEVMNKVPDILTIQIPKEGFRPKQLGNSWIFDRLGLTEEDRKRSQIYKEEAVRSNFKASVKTYQDFIKGLNLNIVIKPFQEKNVARISQLTYRTNQFNFTGLKKSEGDILKISGDSNYESFQVSVSDRFGDYGIIGAIIVDKSAGYFVETFLLSCRVLGKGVEHSLISFLGERAKINNSGHLTIKFTKTAKNIPAEKFLISNFGDLVSVNLNNKIFDIPVERAAGITFDPTDNLSGQQILTEEKPVVRTGSDSCRERNNFYCQVLEKYSSLENIVAELTKNSVTETGKIPDLYQKHEQTEKKVMLVWQQVLKRNDFSLKDNFFDIGGHSVLIPQIVIKLFKQFNIQINIVDIFRFPTVGDLSVFIDGENTIEKPLIDISQNSNDVRSTAIDIAVIGMSGRFSGVNNLEEFWNVISSGKEAITYYTKEELLKNGVDISLLENDNYVLANGNLKTADKFDSAFFGVTPKEADFMDPQHRVFLESCYEALENAGYVSEKYSGEIGVFAGCGMNNYLVKNLFQHPEALKSIGEIQTIINNNSDYLTTRVSYKLNLTGPSMDIQTACSTSLVAIHVACQNLKYHSCDMALAGGVFIQIPHAEGYMYEPGGIFSKDGHCKPFDSDADGMLFGEGTGVVVLKRLDDAKKDCDTILGVIKGTAINNDGSNKVGYMAPSVNGQASVIQKAFMEARIAPETISYIETHGTGTRLGDPIEFSALTSVFKNATSQQNCCALGSVKANIGHLDAAAGVAGVIKVLLMLKNKKLVPLVNFRKPNPELLLNESPFYFNTTLDEWATLDSPKRAAISSFGIGGTNAHCIIEEAPDIDYEGTNVKHHFIPVTAKTKNSLRRLKESMCNHILNTDQNVADISFTLQRGRNHFRHRSFLVCKSESDKSTPLLMTDNEVNGMQDLFNPRVVFMFTGQGSQYIGMTKGLYNEFSTFRDILDKADTILQKIYGINILKYILDESDYSLNNEIELTSVAQPILFTVQYAIARLLEESGLKPDTLIGHSIGEYAAACIAGIFDFEDALKLVAARGALMQEQEPGAMLSVQLPYDKLLPFISGNVCLSLKNAPDLNVLSGDFKHIEEVQKRIAAAYPDINLSKLKTSHAFHSPMMEPVLKPFNEILKKIEFGDCKIPFISNITGTWIGTEEISKAEYWTDQIRSCVNFVDGIQELLKESNSYFVEVGPGNTLSTLLLQYQISGKKPYFSSTTRHPKKKFNDTSVFLKTIGLAWTAGVNIDWDVFYKNEKRYRVPLPSYPFERTRHWIDPKAPFNYFAKIRGDNPLLTTELSDAYSSDVIFDESAHPFHDRPSMEIDFVKPSSEIEKEIVTIWENLLGIMGIGIKDDFFSLGGHSLLASQIIIRLSEKFHIRLPLESLFESPTIEGLARKIESGIPVVSQELEVLTIAQDSRLPVSFDQKRLWIINQINPNNPAYNIPFTYRLKGSLNTDIFTESLVVLFERQAILRSSFKSDEGEPYCLIHNFEKLPVSFLDYCDDPPEKADQQIQDFFTTESRTLFDIENGPLFRLFLVKIRDKEYVFHLTIQHLIFDGWSWGIFAGELCKIYNDLLNNRNISLESLKYQYYDIANWQSKNISEVSYDNSINYWKEKLKDHQPEINFPFDYPRNKTISGFGSRVPFRLSESLSNNVISLGQSENATIFMTLLAAFGLLMNKYSGDYDICFGAPAANRGNSVVEKIIGFFVNTIILRLQFDSSLTFKDLLISSRKTTLEALAHQDLPFEKLVEVLHPERKINVNPIVQISFAYQSTPRPHLDLEGITPERVLIYDTVSPFDLTFYAWENGEIIEGEIEYSTDLFRHDTILRMKENLLSLIDILVENPDVPIDSLSIISEEEKQFIERINETKRDYPKEKSIVELFEDQVSLYPDKSAVVFKGSSLTYNELNEKANQLARTLRKLGVIRDTPVGVYVDKSLEMIVGILGILKSGGAYLPIDPDYPVQRVDFIIKESGCNVLLTQGKYMDISFPGVTKLDLNSPGTYQREKTDIERINSSTDLAYFMYTSGTTGVPKGSMIRHYSVIRTVRNVNYMEMTSEDRILYTSAIVFDVTTYEIWGALLNGMTLYVVEKETILDATALGKELAVNEITILHLTSALFTQLAESRTDIFSGLRYLLIGGDVLSAPHINKVRKDNPGLKVINCYGPSENTTYSTTYLIDKTHEINIPIGKPISNSTVYIFDKHMNYQPIGVMGEIYVGGDGLSKGYLNREDLNSRSFIEHPYISGERLYKTGDFGRWLSDGNIEFQGRVDNQIKIRGFRVELEEIESVISKIEGVIESVIKPVKVEEGDYRLVAFLNVPETFKTEWKEISRQLKERLPSYMVPTAYRFLHGFPKTINGKTDKKALTIEKSELENTDVRDRGELTATEKEIYRIWSDALKTSDITTADNFFDIGGTSLLAISVFTKIEKAFKVEMGLRVFFDSPRIMDLAEYIDMTITKEVKIRPQDTKENISLKTITGEI